MEVHRNTLYYLSIVAMLSAFYKCTADDQTLKYSDLACHGNGHITLTVKDPIQSVVSSCTSGSHSVTVSPTNKTVTVDNCPLNTHVKILMFDDNVGSNMDGTIDSRRVGEAIEVMCDGTDLKVESSIINAPVTFKTVTVSYHEQLTMTLFDNNANNGQTSADTITVGGNYTLQIKATDNLHIHVHSCDASPDNEKNETVHLLISGKPDSTNDVLTTFDETKVQTASATMTGFRFIGKDNVVITCTVDVTTPETTIPPSTSTLNGRRRRNAFQQEHKKSLVVSTSLRVESLSTNGVQGMVTKDVQCILMASILLVKYSLLWF